MENLLERKKEIEEMFKKFSEKELEIRKVLELTIQDKLRLQGAYAEIENLIKKEEPEEIKTDKEE